MYDKGEVGNMKLELVMYFYVALQTTMMFMVAVRPFFQLKKGKKLGWLLIALVYGFNDFYWAYLMRFPLEKYKAIEVIAVYALCMIILNFHFKGNMVRNFCRMFAIDFIYQCCAMVLDLFFALLFVGNSMEKIYNLLQGYLEVAVA